jgi:hypothetical protein
LPSAAVIALCLLFLGPYHSFAAGPYDGIWIGTETVTVAGFGSYTELSFTVVEQTSDATLFVGRYDFASIQDLTSMELNRVGSTWLATGSVSGSELGIDFTISNFRATFSGLSVMSGSYDIEVVDDGERSSGRVTLSHTKRNCTALATPSVTIPNLSGASGSLRCYQLTLPACSQNFRVETTSGRGDADLHVVYGQRDFDYYQSANIDNNESLWPFARIGTWYVGVEGFEAFSGLTLQVSYEEPDADADGVSDCLDLCPSTPASADVDGQGCAYAERDDDDDTVTNGLDNCPAIANTNQADNDNDGSGDACDGDDDNDRLSDEDEQNVHGTNPLVADTDGDGVDDGDEIDAGSNPLFNPVVPVLIINQMLLED